MKKTTGMTAQEYWESKKNDTKYQSMRANKEKRAAELKAKLSEDQSFLIEKLGENNVFVENIWDLVNDDSVYPDVVINVFEECLYGIKMDRNIEGMARAVTRGEYRGKAQKFLFRILENGKYSEEARWSAANGLGVVATPSDLPRLEIVIEGSEKGKVLGELLSVKEHISGSKKA